jgi:hypothetical protein
MPNHDTTRGMIQIVSNSDDPGRLLSFLFWKQQKFPIFHWAWGLYKFLGGFSTGFPVHKGVPSLQNNPSATSPYQCRFLSSKNQVVTLGRSSLDMVDSAQGDKSQFRQVSYFLQGNLLLFFLPEATLVNSSIHNVYWYVCVCMLLLLSSLFV